MWNSFFEQEENVKSVKNVKMRGSEGVMEFNGVRVFIVIRFYKSAHQHINQSAYQALKLIFFKIWLVYSESVPTFDN
jgi:hypothetical protein